MKILIIEDEAELSDSISKYLTTEQFTCEAAYEYHSAIEKIHMNEYSCIILDITLPNGSGLDILTELKKMDKADGVLIVSAKNSMDDKIIGLNTGADDYLAKPFHLPELGARVSAIIRRKSFGGRNQIKIGDLVLDILDKSLKHRQDVVPLTRKEYELLLYLISNKNRVVTKEAIVEHLWGEEVDMADNYDFIYSHIKNLRKKMMNAGAPDYIKVVYGMGYKFMIPSE
ncbi:response regulator transcription factor [Pedobacter hartonius]|uniref:DNA-binding response regulator, OmpR family, contains REC and winged-helix (WHTH) domain n=1 Tax=Pedobacter hartonius TaxID=425514 RepID=A0A1H4E1T8_9SPHI|nr:response regulator transcription factor [Pedobacter hartonius]SEA78787.1 DNA-binding response regulator, OmpR family, contains REC and winged-helix (wHTH) domain [Pedobacter hartonius]